LEGSWCNSRRSVGRQEGGRRDYNKLEGERFRGKCIEFCVKELLTHLHRTAVNNIAFGFTNTRISNYTPGDTFGPLETLLAQQSNVQLSLSMQTSYCFDSESFRYLAAYKQGVM
jgi:hypothetical protein